MAATDLVAVQKQTLDTPTPTRGIEELVTLTQFLALLPTAAAAGSVTAVTRTAAPAAAPVPFADLTAAANSFNALRTALINAGVLI